MVMRVSQKANIGNQPLLSVDTKDATYRLIILISTNKGLCGGLNTNLFRFVMREYVGQSVDVVTLGKKGISIVSLLHGVIKADFSHTNPFSSIVSALTDLVTTEFLSGKYRSVDLVFSEFKSALSQEPTRKSILPLAFVLPDGSETKAGPEFLIEPTPEEVLSKLLPHYIENQIRDAVYQAEASEQSARMIAMRNATDNALSLMDELTLVYNKARQEKITYEISDMVTARLAVE